MRSGTPDITFDPLITNGFQGPTLTEGWLETGDRITPAERNAYSRGVQDVLAIASATAAQLESSPLPVLRRELAIETLRAIVEEGRVLLSSAARESDSKPH